MLSALEQRNADLARLLAGAQEDDRPDGRRWPDAGRVLIVDAEDTFTAMLGHQTPLAGPGRHRPLLDEPYAPRLDGYDLVVMGPGPGDPREHHRPQDRASAPHLIRRLSPRGIPFLGDLPQPPGALRAARARLCPPGSGPTRAPSARSTCSAGPSRVGFYNSYAARHTADRLYRPHVARGAVELSAGDPATGEVHALRGERFAAMQFHPESVLTEHGTDLLADLLGWALRRPAELIECEAER